MNDELTLSILTRLDRLEGRVTTLEAGSTRPQAAAQPLTPPPIKFVQPTPAAPPVIAPPVQDPPAETPEARQAIPVIERLRPAASEQHHRSSAQETEEALGSKILPWTGAGLVLLGIAYLTGLAIQRNLITPAMQFYGAILLCLAFVGVGFWRDRKEEPFGQLLMGIGSAGLYLSFAGGHLTFKVYIGEAMVALFAAHSALNLAFGSMRGSKAFVVLGMIGGLMASVMPLMKGGGAAQEHAVLTLLLHGTVTAATLGICLRKKWDDVMTGFLWLAFAFLLPILGSFSDRESLRGIVLFAYGLAAAGSGTVRLSKSITTVGLLMLALATVYPKFGAESGLQGYGEAILLHAAASAALVYVCVRRRWYDVLGGVGALLILTLLPRVIDPHIQPLTAALTVLGYGAALTVYGLRADLKPLSVAGLSLLAGAAALHVVRVQGEPLGQFDDRHFLPSLLVHAFATATTLAVCLRKGWREELAVIGAALGFALLPIGFTPGVALWQAYLLFAGYGLAITIVGLARDETELAQAGLGVFALTSMIPYVSPQISQSGWQLPLLFNALSTVFAVGVCCRKRWIGAAITFGTVLSIFMLPVALSLNADPMVKAGIIYVYGLGLSVAATSRLAERWSDTVSLAAMACASILGAIGFLVSVQDWTSRLDLRAEAGYGLWAYAILLGVGAWRFVPKPARDGLWTVAASLGLAMAPLAWADSHVLAIYCGLCAALCGLALALRSKLLASVGCAQFTLAMLSYLYIRLQIMEGAMFTLPFSWDERWHLVVLLGLAGLCSSTISFFDAKNADCKTDTLTSDCLAIAASIAAWYLAGNLALLALTSLPENARLTVAWAGVGLALLPLGFLAGRRVVRFASFSLLGLTLGKIIMVDLSQVDLPVRILVLITLGTAILGLSYWFYLRPREGAR